MNNEKYLTVAALTKYLKYKFDSDEHLRTVFLKGEISNLKKHTTGHFYFSIKDESSKINAIMFSSNTKKLKFVPEDGSKVLLVGRVSVYESTGSYQIYVDDMEEDGVGNLYVAFEKLKKQLAQEGLFDVSHKKKIPSIPTRIGIVTAPTGAAVKDILSTIRRRFPVCETLLFPSLVQGESAASDIVRNIKRAQDYDIDVLIVGRGGGSIEDLWPFNEEIVARAIYASSIPVISAVGHEVDFTIADFVADLRAPTPTGAAEMAVPSLAELERHLKQLGIRANESVHKKMQYQKLMLHKMMDSYILRNPIVMYEHKKQYIDGLLEKLSHDIGKILDSKKTKFEKLKEHYLLKTPIKLYEKQLVKVQTFIEKLELLNPLHILKRGFALPYQGGRVVKSIKDIQKACPLEVQMQDGKVFANITEIKEEDV